MPGFWGLSLRRRHELEEMVRTGEGVSTRFEGHHRKCLFKPICLIVSTKWTKIGNNKDDLKHILLALTRALCVTYTLGEFLGFSLSPKLQCHNLVIHTTLSNSKQLYAVQRNSCNLSEHTTNFLVSRFQQTIVTISILPSFDNWLWPLFELLISWKDCDHHSGYTGSPETDTTIQSNPIGPINPW